MFSHYYCGLHQISRSSFARTLSRSEQWTKPRELLRIEDKKHKIGGKNDSIPRYEEGVLGMKSPRKAMYVHGSIWRLPEYLGLQVEREFRRSRIFTGNGDAVGFILLISYNQVQSSLCFIVLTFGEARSSDDDTYAAPTLGRACPSPKAVRPTHQRVRDGGVWFMLGEGIW